MPAHRIEDEGASRESWYFLVDQQRHIAWRRKPPGSPTRRPWRREAAVCGTRSTQGEFFSFAGPSSRQNTKSTSARGPHSVRSSCPVFGAMRSLSFTSSRVLHTCFWCYRLAVPYFRDFLLSSTTAMAECTLSARVLYHKVRYACYAIKFCRL